ncbi:hypothetical protein J2Z83_003369 [Virgibacillus natechei]|uniref:Uncharacterized protein n=1 Tax=Virgibacillus natechei TaxID=1216297 RepID=A0ABS4IJT8_9BACI|nr:hypothetical protein [Virgibacillus natechei]MBP1971230.1 hypothetical protein [Virgibacillus natechei]
MDKNKIKELADYVHNAEKEKQDSPFYPVESQQPFDCLLVILSKQNMVG